MSVSCRGPSERTLFLDEAKLLAITASWGHSTHLLSSYHLFIFLFHFQFSKMFSLFLNLAMSAKLSLFTFYHSLLRVWVHQSTSLLHHLDGFPLHFFLYNLFKTNKISIGHFATTAWLRCSQLGQVFPDATDRQGILSALYSASSQQWPPDCIISVCLSHVWSMNHLRAETLFFRHYTPNI